MPEVPAPGEDHRGAGALHRADHVAVPLRASGLDQRPHSRRERDGVEVDPKALGYTLGAILRIRPSARQLPKVAELARETPEVVECHRITGEDCFFMKLHVRDVEHLEEVLDRFILYGQTTTSIIQSSPVRLRGVSPSA